MKKIFIVLFFMLTTVFGQKVLMPTQTLYASGDVQDMTIVDGKLYVATDGSKIDIFDIKTHTLETSIQIPYIKDFMGKDMPSKIYSVDALGMDVIFVSEGGSGYRILWYFSDGKLSKLLDIDKRYFMRKVRFVDKDKVLLALLTNDHILYDIKQKKEIYNIQFSTSSFSDFTINEDKTKYVSTDESGIVRVIETLSAKVISEYDGYNLDRVFQLDYKNGVILTAGQDRKAFVFKPFGNYSLSFDFLLYSCGLSPSAKYGAVAYNIENDVLVFDISTKQRLYSLTNARATITKILFINEQEIFVSSDSKQIQYYKLN